MTLQIIGSGFGRTGTKSLKAALERLGFGPCHHMHEIAENPEKVSPWQTLAAGGTVNWEDVFEGYKSQVDWPGASVWRDLAQAFPKAKVIHTTRPDDKWIASFDRTIGKLMANYSGMDLPPHIHDILDACRVLIGENTFGGPVSDSALALAAYRRQNAQVPATLPADRLLMFDVAQGWAPLCAFLGVEEPDEPFPHHNLQADFWEVLGGEPT